MADDSGRDKSTLHDLWSRALSRYAETLGAGFATLTVSGLVAVIGLLVAALRSGVWYSWLALFVVVVVVGAASIWRWRTSHSVSREPPAASHSTAAVDPANHGGVTETAGPLFWSNLLGIANSTMWAKVVVGAVPELVGALPELVHQEASRVFQMLEPAAKCERQIGEVSRWLRSDDNFKATWIGEVYAGGIVVMMREVPSDMSVDGRERTISARWLAEWWNAALDGGQQLMRVFGEERAAVGFYLYPYTSSSMGAGGLTSVDSSGATPPVREAEPHTIAPWKFAYGPLGVEQFADAIEPAAADLLKQFSYRQVQPLARAMASWAK